MIPVVADEMQAGPEPILWPSERDWADFANPDSMKLAITSIQRNRNPWVLEWVAFHLLVGFTEFHIYCHKCDDGMAETLQRLGRHYPVHAYAISTDDRPQIAAYRHAWAHHGANVDWMAFIDGDEFLFSPSTPDMQQALARYASQELSALGAYWICYGSSGRLAEPTGLIMENYPRHSREDFDGNRHMKSIVRGGADIDIAGSHLFSTPRGTFDENLRPINQAHLPAPVDPEHDATAPTRRNLRINHYAVQSFDFFRQTKQNMGAADWNASYVRPDAWFHEYDRNECDDGLSYGFLIRLKLKVLELQAAIDR